MMTKLTKERKASDHGIMDEGNDLRAERLKSWDMLLCRK